MRAVFKPSRLCGSIEAPPSKSMSHRYLIAAALSGESCTLSGMHFSEDILATIDCLRALGINITVGAGTVNVNATGFDICEDVCLDCRESGSTLRFLIPLALCLGKRITFCGSERLFERPLGVYEQLCAERGFIFEKSKGSLTVCGRLTCGSYNVRGDVSSQFITGLIFALVYLGGDSCVEIIPPFESRPYVDLTLEALGEIGADVRFTDEFRIEIKGARLHGTSQRIEGDHSNAAFLDAFNYIGSEVKVKNLRADSLQGDKVYRDYFGKIANGTPVLDVSDCPDLAPVLIALASLKNGATLTGTERLAAKESDRGAAMREELLKLGGGLELSEHSIIIPKCSFVCGGRTLDGHNDHRIVMALSVILSQLGGEIDGVEAVRKSYPAFFEDIKVLGAEVEII